MPNFKFIQDASEIPSKGWVDAAKFNKKDALVDFGGRPVSDDYNGRTYRIIAKKRASFFSL